MSNSTPSTARSRSDAVLGNRSVPDSATAKAPYILDGAIPNAEVVEANKAASNALLNYIVSEILEHSSIGNADFEKVQRKVLMFRDQTGAPAARIFSLFDAANEFASLVGYGKKWDQKKTIRSTWGKSVYVEGVQLCYDVWSNIHYGYIGRAIGFNADFLLRMAGFAQAAAFSIPDGWLQRWLEGEPVLSSLDDPRDQTAIKIGISLFENFSAKITIPLLIQEMRPALSHLISDKC